MSPIVRISDDIYKRLESHAVGFDTPSNVIEKLIEYYESRNEKTQNIGKILEKDRKLDNSSRKARNPEKEKELKLRVGKNLNWGDFKLISKSLLMFNTSGKKVLCKFSSYSQEGKNWFWGIPYKYWSNWDDNSYLVLLMENEDQVSNSFILLYPKEASILFENCSESGGDKKISLKSFKSDGLLHIQEWKEYDVEKNIQKMYM